MTTTGKAAKKTKHTSSGDRVMENTQPGDIIVPIMGASGAGKSSFINHILGDTSNQRVKVGADVVSCTQLVQPVCIDIRDTFPYLMRPGDSGRLVLVDTPGFDDTYKGDMDILSRITKWLARSYSKSMTVRGVIFMHDITEVRLRGTMQRCLKTFEKLCGQDAYQKVIIVTSKWDSVTPCESEAHLSPAAVGEKRVQDLKEKAWNELTSGGAIVYNFTPADREKALEVVKLVLMNRAKDSALAAQREVVDRQREVYQIGAAKTLVKQIQEGFGVNVAKKPPFGTRFKQMLGMNVGDFFPHKNPISTIMMMLVPVLVLVVVPVPMLVLVLVLLVIVTSSDGDSTSSVCIQ
ncbi:hypothetical protein CC1G_08498 [Coprinopsis cinerea okayama7|uniref:G domain-containing protein n=1 Tax=Coprinopsis cinerea (strain Okayama-7 / 130 / ATCC MYA-4618 / FGSC 9003) TaxID=240176 RepID=A8ND04_COPC7|nr:hypothetical protein CC1G_08498 [Coprinopsis cinerea okayama7\|eukprot:XP_001832670.2 hypothetical protein CC1G_08498 [Coprinopsis cinerea okayama7\